MPDANDMDLVREFARQSSEMAFAELVRRHVDLVYSVALRFTECAEDAQDVTQAVFIILAKKAGGLREGTVLTGWLYETARFTAARFLRSQARRQAHEQEAYMESLNTSDSHSVWKQLEPHLEAAMSRLGEGDRALLALRFFENKSGAEAAAALGIREDAAHKRTARALEKLRAFFGKRGLSLSAVAIAGAVSANSVQAAPAGLAVSISAVAVAKGAAMGGSTLTLVKGVLQIMAWTKVKTAIVAGTGLLLAAGTTEIVVQKYNDSRVPDSLWMNISYESLQKAPEMVVLRPTHFENYHRADGSGILTFNIRMGRNFTFKDVILYAYYSVTNQYFSPARTVFPSNLPKGNFDFLSTIRGHEAEGLQAEIKRQSGFVLRPRVVETNVLFLRVKNAAITESKAVAESSANSNQAFQLPRWAVAWEGVAQMPIVDQTGLTNVYDFWEIWPTNGNLKETWFKDLEKIGLEVVAGRDSIEMLVVEKEK